MGEHYTFSHIKTLDKIKKDYDVKRGAHAFYPGLHCPLFASVAMSAQIEDLYILVVGTEECAYYSKNLISRMNTDHQRLFTFVLGKNDIAFGCGRKLSGAILKIYKEESCKALLVISTCITELIGEDFDIVISNLEQELDCTIMLVRTNHYQKDSPLLGMEKTLSELVKLMERQIRKLKTVNILGHRLEGFEQTELGKLLEKNSVEVNVRIPTKCKVDTIKSAPSAQLNIVIDFSAIELAEKMKTKFQMDYVYFGKHTNPERIKDCYMALESGLGIEIQDDVSILYSDTLNAINKLKSIVKGRTFVFGMPPMFVYEITSLLCKLGMKPLWLQAVGLREEQIEYKNEILEFANPKVFRALDIPFIKKISDKEQPHYCFTRKDKLYEKTEYQMIEMVEDIKGIGFEVPLDIMKKIISVEDKRDYTNEFI